MLRKLSFTASMLIAMLAVTNRFTLAAGTARRLVMLALASGAMGVALFGLRAFAKLDQTESFAAQLGFLAALIASGIALYLALLQISGILNVRELLRSLRKAS